jgi:hypothetical protein
MFTPILSGGSYFEKNKIKLIGSSSRSVIGYLEHRFFFIRIFFKNFLGLFWVLIAFHFNSFEGAQCP